MKSPETPNDSNYTPSLVVTAIHRLYYPPISAAAPPQGNDTYVITGGAGPRNITFGQRHMYDGCEKSHRYQIART